ncbi:single-stranded DNA-binding protein [Cytophagaceae bacterium ABcell3]|nr:single-stranded DNA-binding protein [Cytophagaceae bacterium ABcell3]
MANIKNKVYLNGFLGRDPEIKTFSNNRTMARMSIGVSESYKNYSGQWMSDTNWHTLVAWGKLAEYAESNLHKGAEVKVEGKLVSRSYEDNSGKRNYITEVVVYDIELVPRKEKAEAE